MYKKLLLSCGLLLGCFLHTSAQKIELSVEGGLQQSWIPEHSEKAPINNCPPGSGFCGYTSSASIDFSYKELPAAYLKGLMLYSVNNRVQVYHNFNLNLLRFQSKTELRELSSGTSNSRYGPVVVDGQPRYAYYLNLCPNEYGYLVTCEKGEEPSTYQGTPDDHIGKTSILYLTQEIGTRYKMMPRLWMFGGVDISYRLYSQVYLPSWSIRYVPVEGEGESSPWGQPNNEEVQISYSTIKDTSGSGFNNLLLGIQTGICYDLNSRIGVTAAYQHSLTQHAAGKASLMRLGVQYKLQSW